MKPIVLAILDGWGYNISRTGNSILTAAKPNLDEIASKYPRLLLQASGLAVGLKWGDSGNSEVGHLSIGAGRIIQQYSTRIDQAIKDKSLFANPVFSEVLRHERIHLIGLLTSGIVHASLDHLLALINYFQQQDKIVFLHLFTDGKDSGLHEGASLLKLIPVSPATVMGRDFGMDRDNNLDLTKIAHDAIESAAGATTDDFAASVDSCYAQGISDAKIPVFTSSSYHGITPGDAMLFFNFREDSMRQIYSSFSNRSDIFIASMTKYTSDDNNFLFSPPATVNNLAEFLSINGKTQLHVAETVKYAHVTIFFNGLRTDPYPQEKDELVQSVKDIENNPAMSAYGVAEKVIAEFNSFDFTVVNFANADMLAHTGNYEATKKGVEAVDDALGKIYRAVVQKGGCLVITSDHGNAEKLIDSHRSEAESKHDSSPIPMYLVGKDFENMPTSSSNDPSGILADVAPTILDLMGLDKPAEMTGLSLLRELPVRGK